MLDTFLKPNSLQRVRFGGIFAFFNSDFSRVENEEQKNKCPTPICNLRSITRRLSINSSSSPHLLCIRINRFVELYIFASVLITLILLIFYSTFELDLERYQWFRNFKTLATDFYLKVFLTSVIG